MPSASDSSPEPTRLERDAIAFATGFLFSAGHLRADGNPEVRRAHDTLRDYLIRTRDTQVAQQPSEMWRYPDVWREPGLNRG